MTLKLERISILKNNLFKVNISDSNPRTIEGRFKESERYECFQIDLNFVIPALKSPGQACIDLGYDTRFDSRDKSTRGTYNTEWMKNNLDNVIRPQNRDAWHSLEPSNPSYQFWNLVEKASSIL